MTLNIKQLAFERNYQLLFSNIDCHLHPGECLQVRGENGSGKSTLLRLIAGYFEPLTGHVLWNEKSITQFRDDYQQAIQYIGHHNGVKNNLTVKENLQLFATLLGATININKIHDILVQMNLSHLINTLAMNLSAGQTRRLALARLLIKKSALWILDEPATALDQHGQQIFTDMMKYHLNRNGMVIITTHQPLIHPLTKTIHLGVNHG